MQNSSTKKPIVGTAKVGGMASYFISNPAYQKAPQLDFKLVKINCKKTELPGDEKQSKRATYEFIWTFRAIFAILFCSLILFSAHLILELSRKNGLREKRSVDVYSKDTIVEWSSENVPSIYEIDIVELVNQEKNILDYIKNDLKIACVQVKSVQKYTGIVFEEFLKNKTDFGLMQTNRLNIVRKLIKSVHDISMRVNILTLNLL